MFQYYVDDLSLDTVKSVIKSYELKEDPYCKKRFDYYAGNQAIMRKEAPEDRPNNKVVTNFCRQVADTYSGYINLQSASTDSDFIRDNLTIMAESLRESLICGISYLLAYFDNAELKLAKLNPATTVLFKSTEVSHNVLGAATWNKYSVYKDGRSQDFVDLYFYDATTVTHYTGITIETVAYESEERHYLNSVPIVEVKTNSQYASIFDGVMDLQDSFNMVDSSYLDGRQTFSNAYLCISGMGISEDTASSLIDSRNKILNLPVQGSSASYLIKPDSAHDVIEMLDNIKRRIFTVCSCPDYNDDKFGNYSGTALKAKLTAFVNNIQNIEFAYRDTLKALMLVLNTEFNFNYNSYAPTDIDSVVDMVVKLKDVVSRRTLLEQLPFVTDVDKELEE